MMRTVIQFLAVVLCAAVIWAQGLIICTSCGREAREGETMCSRCATPLPLPRKEEAPSPAPKIDVSAETVKLAVAAVEGNFRLAREAEAAEPPASSLALCYYQNAMAMMRLVPPNPFRKEVGEALLGGRMRALQAVMVGWVRCKICSG